MKLDTTFIVWVSGAMLLLLGTQAVAVQPSADMVGQHPPFKLFFSRQTSRRDTVEATREAP